MELRILTRYKNTQGVIVGYTVKNLTTGNTQTITHDEAVSILNKQTKYHIINAELLSNGFIRGKGGNIETQTLNKPTQKPKIELVRKLETRTSHGMLSKGWYTIGAEIYLVKGNSIDGHKYGYEPYSEVIASRLLKALGLPVVEYHLKEADLFPDIRLEYIKHVSICKSYLRTDTNYTPFAKFVDSRVMGVTKVSHYLDWLLKNTAKLPLTYVFKMLIADAFIGNEDRHLNNWDIGENSQGWFYPPMMDFGASLLAWQDHQEIARVLRAKGTAYGPDKSKPFAELHNKQLILIKRYTSRLGIDIRLPANSLDIVEDVIARSEDVFRYLPTQRAEAVKKYIRLRTKYLELFI